MSGYPFLFAFWDAADKLLYVDEWSALCNVCHLKHAQNKTPSAWCAASAKILPLTSFFTDCYCWSLLLFAVAGTFTWIFVMNFTLDKEEMRHCYLTLTYLRMFGSYLKCSKFTIDLYTITASFLCQSPLVQCWHVRCVIAVWQLPTKFQLFLHSPVVQQRSVHWHYNISQIAFILK
jgi:hypothetical protein